MKNIVGIVGSPRRSGNTSTMINTILNGAKEKGAQTDIFYLNDMSIKSCQSCMYCRSHDNCCIKDDMQKIYEKIKSADAVVIGSPIYIYQVSGLTKIMMDRLYPLTDENHKPRFGQKKLVLVYTQAAPFPFVFKTYTHYMRKAFKAMGLKHYKDIILTKCFDPNIAINNKNQMNKAFLFGKTLV